VAAEVSERVSSDSKYQSTSLGLFAERFHQNNFTRHMPIDFSKFKPSAKEQPPVDPIAIFQRLRIKDSSINDLWLCPRRCIACLASIDLFAAK
jgi:hypothetical protein